MYETDPAGNYYEYKAQAIGDRSQSGRTYLERNYDSFPNGLFLLITIIKLFVFRIFSIPALEFFFLPDGYDVSNFVATPDQLITHGLKALRSTISEKKETLSKKVDNEIYSLDEKNCAVGIVGIGQPFKILTGDDLRVYFDNIDVEQGEGMVV